MVDAFDNAYADEIQRVIDQYYESYSQPNGPDINLQEEILNFI